MANKPVSNDMRDLWQRREVENVTITVDELKRRAQALQRRIRRRHVWEYAASAFVIISFGRYCVVTHTMIMRISFALIVAGCIFVTWRIHSGGEVRPLPADMGLEGSAAFYRRELERQRQLLRGIWRWYFGPFVPGLAVFVAGVVISAPYGNRWANILAVAFTVAVFWWIAGLNSKAAKRLDAQIEELGSLEMAD